MAIAKPSISQNRAGVFREPGVVLHHFSSGTY